MGTEPGKNFTRLIQDLLKFAPRYDFFHAVFLAEMVRQSLNPAQDAAKLEQTGLRFQPYPDFVYPPTDIREFQFEAGVMTFVLNFMGLYGINSPLPRCYHEQVAFQQNLFLPGMVPLQNFFDLFNNRFYWLYYQAWKKYRYYLQFSDDVKQPMMQRVSAFIGQDPIHQSQTGRLNLYKLLQCSGILSNRIRSRAGLEILLGEFFPGCRMVIHEFVRHMVVLSERPQLGGSDPVKSFQLGVNSVVGRSMPDFNSRIRLEIGPIEFTEFLDFIPGGRLAQLLNRLLSLYLNDGLEYNIRLIIRSAGIAQVPWNDPRLKLGQTIWLGRPKQELVAVNYQFEEYVVR